MAEDVAPMKPVSSPRIGEFYWTCAKHFGGCVKETRVADLMFGLGLALITSVVGFLLRDRDWLKGLMIGVAALVAYFSLFWLRHLWKTPVLIHSYPETENKAKAAPGIYGAVGIAVIVLMIGLCVTIGWRWCTGRSFAEAESKDSLRLKTISIANKLQHYLEGRAPQHPPYAYPDSRDPNPTDEQKQKIAACQKYDGETWNYYHDNFMKQMVAISAVAGYARQ
jgi:hypothetical protein